LLSLRDATFTSVVALSDGVATALSVPAALPSRQRALQIGAAAAFPLLVTAATVVALTASRDRAASGAVFWITLLAVCSGTFMIPAILGVIGAAVTGSGFTFRPFGAALVNRRGERASRVRALWRSIVTWIPLLPVLGLFAFSKTPEYRTTASLVQTLIMAGMLAAALWSIARTPRGIQDRLSGTWIVPR
jgi:hypothetical protein